MEESIRVTEAGRHSALLLLPEEGFHTTVILDPGAGPGVDQHGDDVLVAHARSERQDVLPWWPIAKKPQQLAFIHFFCQSFSVTLVPRSKHAILKVEFPLSYRSKLVLRSSS